MTAQYTMGGWDERLRLGQYNDDAILTCFEYYRPVGAGTPFANEEGMVRWKTTEHIITGPLQEIDTQSRGQATINRTIIMQGRVQVRDQGHPGRERDRPATRSGWWDIINGVNKVRRLKEGVSDANRHSEQYGTG